MEKIIYHIIIYVSKGNPMGRGGGGGAFYVNIFLNTSYNGSGI